MRYRRNQCCDYAQGWAVRGAHPERDKIFFSLLHKRPEWLWGPPSSLLHGYNTGFFFYRRQSFRGVNLITCIHPEPRLKYLYFHSHTCLQGVERDDITLYVARYMCAYSVSCLSN